MAPSCCPRFRVIRSGQNFHPVLEDVSRMRSAFMRLAFGADCDSEAMAQLADVGPKPKGRPAAKIIGNDAARPFLDKQKQRLSFLAGDREGAAIGQDPARRQLA